MLKMLMVEGKRNNLNDNEKEIMLWLLHKLLLVVTGNRWKPLEKKKSSKTSFVRNVSNSDLAFAVYLLRNYSAKVDEGKKRGRMTLDKHKTALVEYNIWTKEFVVLKKTLNSDDKEVLDKWVISFIAEKVGRTIVQSDDEGPNEVVGSDEERRQQQVNNNLFYVDGMEELVEGSESYEQV
jgi:hypothetical protein